jgi:hypothetical protein
VTAKKRPIFLTQAEFVLRLRMRQRVVGAFSGGFMTLIRRTGFAIVAVILSACSSDGIAAPPPGFTNAAATSDCGPADGPAVAIYLASAELRSLPPQPATPYIRIWLPRDLSELPGKTWTLAGAKSEVGVWLYTGATNPELASGGFVVIKSVEADNSIRGTMAVQFPSGRVSGGFNATWIPQTGPICG